MSAEVAAVERVRAALHASRNTIGRGRTPDVRTLLAAYDDRGKEIEALKKSEERSASWLDYAGRELDSARNQRDALRAWALIAGHFPRCHVRDYGNATEEICDCGLRAALDMK